MKFWTNPGIVAKTPFVTTALLEFANTGQLWRMWATGTSAGQSIWSWSAVWIALALWCNYYRVMLPNEKFSFYCTLFGIFMNSLVIASVAYFRYWVGS